MRGFVRTLATNMIFMKAKYNLTENEYASPSSSWVCVETGSGYSSPGTLRCLLPGESLLTFSMRRLLC